MQKGNACKIVINYESSSSQNFIGTEHLITDTISDPNTTPESPDSSL